MGKVSIYLSLLYYANVVNTEYCEKQSLGMLLNKAISVIYVVLFVNTLYLVVAA